MTDDYNEPEPEGVERGELRWAYEPPAVSALGNARDILAGGGGTYMDSDTELPDFPAGG